jgi:hypothetical protein
MLVTWLKELFGLLFDGPAPTEHSDRVCNAELTLEAVSLSGELEVQRLQTPGRSPVAFNHD